ncbi:MAG: hypothetical protein HY549_03540 [Elusimicrobia bacterium]|nr:hypothetical protein [Elusimicrobiota bacterium]
MALAWTLAFDPVPLRAEEGQAVRIRPKKETAADWKREPGLLQPNPDVIDLPTAAVLDYGGYAPKSRFFSNGGVLQYLSFGVFHGLSLGASLNVDGFIGTQRIVRLRAPSVQVKYRFFDGDRFLPALAAGYDGQGYLYNQLTKRYNHKQRGFFVVGTLELGVPGLEFHPSANISDFDSNSIFGAMALSYNIQDRLSLLSEWDNVNNFRDSRFNSGVRVFITPRFHLDFAVRAIGEGGRFSDGNSRGPERIVQIKYSGNF